MNGQKADKTGKSGQKTPSSGWTSTAAQNDRWESRAGDVNGWPGLTCCSPGSRHLGGLQKGRMHQRGFHPSLTMWPGIQSRTRPQPYPWGQHRPQGKTDTWWNNYKAGRSELRRQHPQGVMGSQTWAVNPVEEETRLPRERQLWGES